MTTADVFPAAVHEKQKTPQSPDFQSQALRLEDMALAGIETPTGLESYQFRVGMEIEFRLTEPETWRDDMAKHEATQLAVHEKSIKEITIDAVREDVISYFQNQRTRVRNQQYGMIKNPETIEGSKIDRTELLADFKDYAATYIGRLPADNEIEEQRRTKWLAEIPEFGVSELVNFLLYEEFSKPSLGDTTPPADGTINDLDDFSERQGWLEFRFGTGKLQTGYYDNDGVSEIRLAPCPPSEAIRRKEIISSRMAEIGSQLGILVQSSGAYEHINLSAYKPNDRGEWVAVIGHDTEHRDKTLDLTSGIAESFQDGIWLHPEDMQWGYKFDAEHGGSKITFSPTRSSVRILDGRIELRTGFQQADQATNLLVAGAIAGLQDGQEAIEQRGLQTLQLTTIYQVHRNVGFDKQVHLPIQRAFEKCDIKVDENGERFILNVGFNMVRGENIAEALIGKQATMYGCDAFNDAVFRSIVVDSSGIPSVDASLLGQQYSASEGRKRELLDTFLSEDFDSKISQMNEQLKTVSLMPTDVIAGRIDYKPASVEAALERIRQSESGKLAYGDQLEQYADWLEAAAP